MKYSQSIGIIASLLLIFVCFIPWSFISSREITITGMSAIGTDFGKPGLMNIMLTSVSIVLFLIPNIIVKRANMVFAALNFAWAARNYLLVTGCLMGECPEKRPGIYLLLALSAVILLMSFLPKIRIQKREEE